MPLNDSLRQCRLLLLLALAVVAAGPLSGSAPQKLPIRPTPKAAPQQEQKPSNELAVKARFLLHEAIQASDSGEKDKAAEMYKQAADAFQAALLAAPRDLGLLRDAALAYTLVQQYDRAIRTYKQALELRPDDAELHTSLGSILHAYSHDIDGAISEYRAAIKLQPNESRHHFSLGYVLYDKKDFPASVQELREATRLNPQNASYHSHLAASLRATGDLDGAISEYRKALALGLDQILEPRVHLALGQTLRSKGDLYGDISEAQAAVRLNPDYEMAHNELGHAYLAIGKHQESMAACRASLRINPKGAYPHLCLGWNLAALGDKASARQEYEVLRELDANLAAQLSSAIAGPDYPKLRKYLEAGLYREAEQALERELKQNEFDPLLRLLYGRALVGMNRIDDAINQFRAALKLRPEQWDAIWQMAGAYLARYKAQNSLSDRVGAAESLEQLLVFRLPEQSSTEDRAAFRAAQQQATALLGALYSPEGTWQGHDERVYAIEKADAEGTFWLSLRPRVGQPDTFSVVKLRRVDVSTFVGDTQPGALGSDCLGFVEFSGKLSEKGTRFLIEGIPREVKGGIPKEWTDSGMRARNWACKQVFQPFIGKAMFELKLQRIR